MVARMDSDGGGHITDYEGYTIRRPFALMFSLMVVIAALASMQRTAGDGGGPPIVLPFSPPDADFAWSPSIPDEGSVVQFTDLSTDLDNDILFWLWQFGDGWTSQLRNPSYAYGDDGPYQVTLTVTDLNGLQDSMTRPVDISNIPPEVHVNTPLILTLTQGNMTAAIPPIERAEDVVSFYNYSSASSHTGFEQAYESKVFLYRDTIANALHLFFTHGVDNGPSAFSEVFFDLSGIPAGAYVSQSDDPTHCWDPPRCEEFSLAYPGGEGHWMYAHNTDGGILSGLPFNSSWCISVTPQHWSGVNAWVYHFANGDAINLDMTLPVTICYTPPPAGQNTISIDEGDQVEISGFFDDPGWGDIQSAVWTFGDSTAEIAAFSSGVGPSHYDVEPVFHRYGDDGEYSACLQVTDDDGGMGRSCVNVTVGNVAPTVDPLSSTIISKGEALSYNVFATDPGSDDLTFTWNWGDGTPENVTSYLNDGVGQDRFPSSSGIYPFSVTDEVTHMYDDTGSHNVTLRVVDDDGGENVLAATVTVVAPDLVPWDVHVNGNPYTVPVRVVLGSDVDISAKVRNLGTGNATNRFYLSVTDPTTTQSMGIHRLDTGRISIGTLTHTWTAKTPGVLEFYIEVDPSNDIVELDEDNNWRLVEVVVEGPDLIPDDIEIDGQKYLSPVQTDSGKTLSISVLVANIGESSTEKSFTTAFYNAAHSANIYTSQEISELDAEERSGRIILNWEAPSTEGEYAITIEVDYGHSIPELNEENNMVTVHIRVEATSPLPLALNAEWNHKPLIALIFTSILAILGGLVGYRRPLDISMPPQEGEVAKTERKLLRKRTIEEKLLILEEEELTNKFSRDRHLTMMALALPFAVAETIIGALSLVTGLLRVPEDGSWLSLGLLVNIAVLIVGIVYVLLLSRRGYRVPKEEKLRALREADEPHS
jgi:PKD repeat protein